MCNGLTELPKPCDYFHLIGGTGTGGYVDLNVGIIRWNLMSYISIYQTRCDNAGSTSDVNCRSFGALQVAH